MKFMPQDIFDVGVLMLIKAKNDKSLGGYELVKSYMLESYSKSYPGDNLWMQQTEQLATEFLNTSAFNSAAAMDVLNGAIEVRMKLDENMKERGTLKKILGGTIFSNSHPGPSVRIEVARNNIKQLFAAVGTAIMKR